MGYDPDITVLWIDRCVCAYDGRYYEAKPGTEGDGIGIESTAQAERKRFETGLRFGIEIAEKTKKRGAQ